MRGLELLAASAGQPGFVRAATRFVAELDGSVPVSSRRASPVPCASGRASGPRRAYADELAAVYRRYREGLAEAGLVARELHRWGALDALRREPERWGATPVFVYGFDDFTRLELDALETVAVHCGADVVVSLPFEPGRLAFKAISGIVAELSQLAASTVALERGLRPLPPELARDAAPLERGLFEDVAAEDAELGGPGGARAHRRGRARRGRARGRRACWSCCAMARRPATSPSSCATRSRTRR